MESSMTLRNACRSTLLLALASAAAATTLAQAQPMMGPGGPGGMHGAAMHAHPGMGLGPMLDGRLLDTVGATADQKTRVHDIYKTAQDEVRRLLDGQREQHQQMMQLLTAPKIDAVAAEALRQKLQAGHDTASKRMLQASLDAAAVLTPEQRQKLGERMKSRRDMMERHQRERHALDPNS
jgi:Spy/CpxP family protein refolding chaperone